MNKFTLGIILAVFPILALAADSGSLSFTPPPGDVSVIFLGNIFGVVDGVLHGTGSQIMGSIFSVFNAAVLALGGIVIMYTLLVSTVNTAHEGEMLGRKWSTMWIPVRATLGLALLIPKASGYCVMQILVMWVVVQGIGAADKVWDAALGYLNRGGTIVQENINPIISIMGGGNTISSGAAKILQAQVCMNGLQALLTNKRQALLNMANNDSGACNGTPDDNIALFCKTPVPDFVGSVNAISYQTDMSGNCTTSTTPYSSTSQPTPCYQMPMPNFDSTSPYAFLNGICGTLSWNALDTSPLSSINTLTKSDSTTVSFSRAIAIQQMYIGLASIAETMVNNDPQLQLSDENNTQSTYTPFATSQFGVPYLNTGVPCTQPVIVGVDVGCVGWGKATGDTSNSLPIFNGTEFQTAVADYNAVMLPTVTLYNQAQNQTSDTAQAQKDFLVDASTSGWLLAGSYFFKLAYLSNAHITTTGTPTTVTTGTTASTTSTVPSDYGSGLENSVYLGSTNVPGAFSSGECQGTYQSLCVWLQKDVTLANKIDTLISNNGEVSDPQVQGQNTTSNPQVTPVTSSNSATTNAYINNSLARTIPGQPGITQPAFGMNLIPQFGAPGISMKPKTFPCGFSIGILWGTFCIEQVFDNIMYNDLLVNAVNLFLSVVMGIINTVLMAFLALPLAGIYMIFSRALDYIAQPNVNPIIGLANMGVFYINFSMNLWIFLTGVAAIAAVLTAATVMPLIAILMPMVLAWTSIMILIGFITAYFVPFLPYMIFTFGSIGWFMAVIEAMVAAPIVALGITHPEGEGPFGKGEQAIMILMNVFLRPTLMVLGFIAGISLSYVGTWVINAGFSNVLGFIQGDYGGGINVGASVDVSGTQSTNSGTWVAGSGMTHSTAANGQQIGDVGYSSWAGIYSFFFSVIIYTAMYIIVVQKSFTLISLLPDKVLRWIGGSPESWGQDSGQWTEEAKGRVEKGAESTSQAAGAQGKLLMAQATKGGVALHDKLKSSGPSFEAESTKGGED